MHKICIKYTYICTQRFLEESLAEAESIRRLDKKLAEQEALEAARRAVRVLH